jgi:hypothetical protein
MVSFPELLLGSQQPHFNSTFCHMQHSCDIAYAAVIEVFEVDQRFFFQVEPAKRCFEAFQIDFLLKNRVEIDIVLKVFTFLMYHHDLSFADTHQVHAMIIRNGEKPGGELRVFLESTHFGHEFQKNVVRDVFRTSGIFGKGNTFLVHLQGVPLVKLLKMTVVLRFQEKSN